MRLLNAQTRMFEEYHDGVPEYVILSHTWEQEEVIHADMIALQKDPSSEVQRKIGLRKIEMTCQRALEDGFSFVWIDTCCIDKTSSAELSEAINSMFNWYQDASVCYVYLADVAPDFDAFPRFRNQDTLSDEECETLLDSTFATTRWFTRGWTLQELIAPCEVWFYNKDFEFIGTKAGLAYIIHRITGIDESLLANEASVSDFCVARKMSWAAKRKTTRVEDVAYSLFGIFDVNLPLLYGEGTRAFQRLQEEIIRTSDDQSILAWEPHVQRFYAQRRSELLAPTPVNFAKCGRMVRWTLPGVDTIPPPVRTKLNIRLPVVKFENEASDVERVAVIGCRYEDNFVGPIGLRLRESHHLQPEKRYTLVQEGPYLTVVPIREVEASRLEVVTIAEILEPEISIPGILLRRDLKCWVIFIGNEKKYSIEQAHPSRHWNTQTNLFIPSQRGNVSAGAHFTRDDGMGFILTFGYFRENAIHLGRYCDEWVCLEEPIEGRVKEQLSTVRSSSQHDGAISQLLLQGKHTVNNIEATIAMTEIMGEMIFLIKIRIREGRGV